MLIYKTQGRSYRDLPLRFFELGNVCRHEKSGVLHGLLRVRNFTQDDAHIFCKPEDLQAEIASVVDFAFYTLDVFGFKEREIEISTRPKESIGTAEQWDQATAALEGALKSKGVSYKICAGEGAFYGPKIDIKIKDALRRSWQCSTIQCDYFLPERFDLEYTGQDGAKHRPVMLHRAILGSVERFLGTLLEHYAGALPLWLSPVQVSIIPVAQPHEAEAQKILQQLKDAGFRAELQTTEQTLGARIRNAQNEKIPYMIVLGDKEIQSGKIALRSRSLGDLGQMGLLEFIEKVKREVELKQ
jgi:threonyl-tRNA synthetase